VTQRSRFTQADVSRLLKAAHASGYEQAIVVAHANGSLELRVSTDKPVKLVNEWQIWSSFLWRSCSVPGG
jgi:hypothetical protein